MPTKNEISLLRKIDSYSASKRFIFLVLIFIFFSFGFLYGYGRGASAVADACTNTALHFIKASNVTIQLDGQMIQAAIAKYGALR